jgi:Spy/CpxP family protein refolding chaperone
MKNSSSKNILLVLLLVLATTGLVLTAVYAQAPAPGAAQTPPAAGAPAPPGGRGGRGGGLPGATAEQNQAVMDLNAALAPLVTAAATARNELAMTAFGDVRNEANIGAVVEKLRQAELALATARAEAFARLQAGPNKLNPEQVTALVGAGGNLPAGRGGGGRGPGQAPPGAGAAGPGTGAPAAPPGRGRGN